MCLILPQELLPSVNTAFSPPISWCVHISSGLQQRLHPWRTLTLRPALACLPPLSEPALFCQGPVPGKAGPWPSWGCEGVNKSLGLASEDKFNPDLAKSPELGGAQAQHGRFCLFPFNLAKCVMKPGSPQVLRGADKIFGPLLWRLSTLPLIRLVSRKC